ncbi:XPG-I multi-domain protein [Pyrenophora tritici-repentis]|uniref:XPG-I multi-domain protein n=1 Tax=Pyrenophora tritici-repentis TaxID=45151 RepID=A0A317AIY4_9PLEO|nr:flap structure-specific endonuclease [Pyrenophora tritici-repentis]KAF7574412.1 XPG-I multi-domain protein [Pyrenophora tritici-repentis]
MGIHGIYKEIGPGRRVALSKLAVEKFEETGRPLRIAIDTSIWLFQIQASKGGTNPALRTFYYRLLRLIALAIHPIFVFDGPNKPPFKRNKRTGPNVASIPEFLAKQLLKQFGYPIHLAPGEAEAECALLQREGIVDAVLSEDVDTLMFGSGITIRNWSPEKSGNTPTHVNVYDAVETKNGQSGLDREGMILVAMMSGGDYVPEGIPGCGPKTACEAAKAGFGAELCKIPKNDARAMSEWKARLQHELKTNESKIFKRKHGALKIPDDFPRLDILGYYTHPAISNQAGLDKLRRSINWDKELDFSGLREFTHDAFDWVKLEGAKHFIRSLAPSMVVRQLRMCAEQRERLPTTNVQAIQEDESLVVKGLHGKRQHPVTDNCTELRVSFTPIELVKIDLSKEDPDDDIEIPPPSSQQAGGDADLDDDMDDDGPKKRGPTKFDPTKDARIWVMETFVKIGVPLKVQDWEAERQRKLKPKRAATPQESVDTAPKTKPAAKTKTTKNQPQARIETFAKVTKPGLRLARALAQSQEKISDPPLTPPRPTTQPQEDVLDLSSPSPVRTRAQAPPQPQRQKSLSPVPIELPPSVTKRRRRAPIQRSKTLPADTSTILDRPSTPPLPTSIETLDLVDSPARPSPSQLPAKKAKTRRTKDAATTRASRDKSVHIPSVKSMQSTLDAWRASVTPTKPRRATPALDSQPAPPPPRLRSVSEEVDSLDLTLSPEDSGAARIHQDDSAVLRIVASSVARPPLTSLSPNTSNTSTQSRSSGSAKKKSVKDIFGPRRTSPRLSKITSAPAELATLDLTSPRLAPAKPKQTSPTVDTIDLTELSSPVFERVSEPQQQPSVTALISPPQTHSSPSLRSQKSTSPQQPSRASPPAAWKARERKKRAIILRKSVPGAWDFVDVDSPEKTGEGAVGLVPKGKDRRKWRESAVEELDLT